MTKEQLEYLERIRQLAQYISNWNNTFDIEDAANIILQNIEHIKQGEEK